jgi:coproporphyrinogen III oxidase-like Fe-S oxidoreductase
MFEKILSSGLIESCSLYTLELFPGSDRYNALHNVSSHDRDGLALKKYGTDDDVYEEFELLKDIILGCGMARYEISNFSFAGANSIHNRVYRSYGERL